MTIWVIRSWFKGSTRTRRGVTRVTIIIAQNECWTNAIMRTKNPKPKRHTIAAQTKSEKPAHKKDQKAWPQASKKGWCVGGIVVLQLGLCLVAMQLICWQLTDCQHVYMQGCKKVFASTAEFICHQGQIKERQATVSLKFIKEQTKYIIDNANINVCLQRGPTAFAWDRKSK